MKYMLDENFWPGFAINFSVLRVDFKKEMGSSERSIGMFQENLWWICLKYLTIFSTLARLVGYSFWRLATDRKYRNTAVICLTQRTLASHKCTESLGYIRKLAIVRVPASQSLAKYRNYLVGLALRSSATVYGQGIILSETTYTILLWQLFLTFCCTIPIGLFVLSGLRCQAGEAPTTMRQYKNHAVHSLNLTLPFRCHWMTK